MSHSGQGLFSCRMCHTKGSENSYCVFIFTLGRGYFPAECVTQKGVKIAGVILFSLCFNTFFCFQAQNLQRYGLFAKRYSLLSEVVLTFHGED